MTLFKRKCWICGKKTGVILMVLNCMDEPQYYHDACVREVSENPEKYKDWEVARSLSILQSISSCKHFTDGLITDLKNYGKEIYNT